MKCVLWRSFLCHRHFLYIYSVCVTNTWCDVFNYCSHTSYIWPFLQRQMILIVVCRPMQILSNLHSFLIVESWGAVDVLCVHLTKNLQQIYYNKWYGAPVYSTRVRNFQGVGINSRNKPIGGVIRARVLKNLRFGNLWYYGNWIWT